MSDCRFSLKFVVIVLLALLVLFTVSFCFLKPKMHKPFQMNIIEYMLKINPDGTTTTTKNVTTTLIKEK